ncbi:hypothetical protein EHM69_01710 [candidate division KSB1 bacterium]|nr:MAG: hypothetical protein EHM69_01710 [candidate division KSB1 bacterium]
MVNKHIAILFIVFSLMFASAMAEESPQVRVEGSNVARYDNGDETDSRRPSSEYPDNTVSRRYFENRLRLDLYRGNFRVGGRFLYFRPSNEDQLRDGLQEENRIDKRYLEATVYPFKLRAGHFSDLWGHGLALSAFENRDLYFDSELDGFRAELESEPLFVTALRGTSQEGRLVKKADVSGARVNLRFAGQGMGFNHVTVDSGAYLETNVSSIDWRFSRGIVTVFGERAWSKVVLHRASSIGHATYFGSVLSNWGWSLLLEYKDYDYHSATPFQNPAVVYRETGPRLLQGREPHVMNIPNEVGYQAELSGQLTSTTFTTLHYNLSSRHPRRDVNLFSFWQDIIPLPVLEEKHAPYWELFASVEQNLPQDRTLFLELGANEEAATGWQERMWAWLKFSTPFRTSQALEFEAEALRVTERNRNDRKLTDYLVGLSWDDGRGFSLAFHQELTDDKELEKREGKSWPSVETAISIGRGKHRLIAFYGRERGGLRCSNGVCRQVQAFTGLRFTLESTL